MIRLRHFFQYLERHKKYWLVPILLVMILLVVLLVLAESRPAGPFIYPLH